MAPNITEIGSTFRTSLSGAQFTELIIVEFDGIVSSLPPTQLMVIGKLLLPPQGHEDDS